jgi:hypothetical protein
LERFVFEVKKLPNCKKDLQTVESEAQNQSKKTITAGKRSFCQRYCEFSAGGEWVSTHAYQVLLC